MGLKGLPETFQTWEKMRKEHLQQDLGYSKYTKDLFQEYRSHLGLVRYRILLETQTLLTPQRVRELLGFSNTSLIKPLLWLYKLSRPIKLDRLLKPLLLPQDCKKEI